MYINGFHQILEVHSHYFFKYSSYLFLLSSGNVHHIAQPTHSPPHAGPVSPAQSWVALWDLFLPSSWREALGRGTECLLDFILPMYLALILVTSVCPCCNDMLRVEDSWTGRGLVKWLSPSLKVFRHQRCKNFTRVKVFKHFHFLSMEACSSPKSEK